MAKLDIDFLRDLQEAGFPAKQAETLIRVIADKTTGQLVTKADLADLELRLEKRFADIEARFANMEVKMAAMETRIIKWVAAIVVGSNIALVGAVAAIMALIR